MTPPGHIRVEQLAVPYVINASRTPSAGEYKLSNEWCICNTSLIKLVSTRGIMARGFI